MQSWQMQEAKAKLSEVVKRAEVDGPQGLTHHGRDVAVVVSRATFDRLTTQGHGLLAFMQASPLALLDDGFVFERDPSLTRELPL